MDRTEEGMGDGRGDGRDWMKNEDSERQYARQGESHKDFTAIRSCCWLILHDAVSAPLTDSSRGSADHSSPPPRPPSPLVRIHNALRRRRTTSGRRIVSKKAR